eukprot:1204787-Karenia_brevis.AAC.1
MFVAQWASQLDSDATGLMDELSYSSLPVAAGGAICTNIDTSPFSVDWGSHEGTQLEIIGDSMLVVEWTRGAWACNSNDLHSLLNE